MWPPIFNIQQDTATRIIKGTILKHQAVILLINRTNLRDFYIQKDTKKLEYLENSDLFKVQ